MYMLLSQGKHPLFEPEIDTSESYIAKLSNPKWEFEPHITPTAINFFLKLVQVDPADRFTADQMLTHPWITRNTSDKIPMTIGERMRIFDQEQTLSRVIIHLVYMIFFPFK